MVAHGDDARLALFKSHQPGAPAVRANTVLRALLSIQSLQVRGFHFDAEGVVLDVVPSWRRPRCGECGGLCGAIHDRRLRRWRHLDLAGMKVHLRYRARRAFCESCGTVKTEEVPWAGGVGWYTYAFEERVAYLAQQSSKTAVSELLRVSWRAVGRIIQRVVARDQDARGDRLAGLREIGVDELSFMKHHKYITVVVDHEQARVVWAWEGKSAATLKRFFGELGPERCKALESVTLDLSQAYISAVREAAPQARLIFDRFHVQRLAHDALDETRREEVRKAVNKDEQRALKGTRWALHKNPWNLTDAEQLTIAELEQQNLPMFRAHMLKETLVGILDGRRIHVARRKLEEWVDFARESALKPFVRVAGTIEKRVDGILEYIRSGRNNGRVEGLNGKARTITRRSYGFHSANSLIAMIYLCCGGVHVTPAHSRPGVTH